MEVAKRVSFQGMKPFHLKGQRSTQQEVESCQKQDKCVPWERASESEQENVAERNSPPGEGVLVWSGLWVLMDHQSLLDFLNQC